MKKQNVVTNDLLDIDNRKAEKNYSHKVSFSFDDTTKEYDIKDIERINNREKK